MECTANIPLLGCASSKVSSQYYDVNSISPHASSSHVTNDDREVGTRAHGYGGLLTAFSVASQEVTAFQNLARFRGDSGSLPLLPVIARPR